MMQRSGGRGRLAAPLAALDVCQIVDTIEARVTAQLRRGKHAIAGEPGAPPLRIRVAERGAATAVVAVRSDGAQIALSQAEARFTPPLAIRNPAHALDRKRSGLSKLVLDLLADLELQELTLDPATGQLTTSLDAVVLGLLRVPYHAHTDVLAKLRVPVPLHPTPPAAHERTPLARVVGPAAAVLERARIELSARTWPLGVPKIPGVTLALGRVGLHPALELWTEDGALHWRIAPTGVAQVECDLFRAMLSSEGELSIGAEDRCQARGQASAVISTRSWPLILSPAPGFAIPVVFDQDATVALDTAFAWTDGEPVAAEPVRAVFDLRGGIGDDGITFAGATLSFADSAVTIAGEAHLELGGQRIAVAGSGLSAKLELQTPTLQLGSTRLSVDGKIAASYQVASLAAAGDGLRLAGTLDLALEVAGLEREQQVLERRKLPVSFALYQDGTLAMGPLDGALDALEPWIDLNGDVTKVRDLARPAAGRPGSAEIRRAIAEQTGAAPSEGNHVELLVDGITSLPRRTALIDGAKRSICVQALIFQDDGTGREIARLLVAKAKQGVKVRVIIDTLGNIDPFAPLTRALDHDVYQILRDGGVDLRLYNGPDGVLGDVADKLLAELLTSAKASLDPVAILGALTRIVRREKARPDGAGVGSLQRAANKIMRKAARTTTAPRAGDSFDFDDLLLVVRAAAALNHRWHEKYLIVDERVAIMGGMNIADEYLLGGTAARVHDRPAWRDTDVAIQGPAVADIHHAFAKSWRLLSGETLPAAKPIAAPAGAKANALIVQHRPREEGDHNIQNALLEHVVALGPGDRAWFANAYVLPVGGLTPLRAALVQAAARGVDVRIITNSADTTDLKQLYYASVFHYRQFIEAGIGIWERTGDRTMHSKYAVLGPHTVAIGSWNMDNRSESLNAECLALLDDPALAEQTAATFLADAQLGVASELQRGSILSQPTAIELRSLACSTLAEMM